MESIGKAEGQRLMAASLTARKSPFSSSYLQRGKSRRLPCVRCSSGSPGSGGDGTPPLVRAAVSAITELLRVLSPKNPRVALQKGATGAELDLPCSVDDVVTVLEADYQQAYFLTGNFTPDIYAEDCLFEDPTIKFRGRSRYSQNLDLLVPFFDSPSLELENIEKVTLPAKIVKFPMMYLQLQCMSFFHSFLLACCGYLHMSISISRLPLCS
ncbi:hypothetical protein GUJ93_ZPchr0007g4189 [Zizania palustris]|uniref:Uncharacterized protein n=1 Tax=Zizania palustris TaxID=103762 RepID=A0A8J5VUC9_ZIZPA|nr:hypothetical protein GUJ93_ZPchr0007g4189 [Zizania palustris]